MSALKVFKTSAELFIFLTEEYKKRNNKDKFVMMEKINGKFVGITYQQFKEETENFAYGLLKMGIRKDDKIAIISENRPEWIYFDMAVLGIGAINVPLYPSLTADSIEFILNNSETKIIVVSNKFHLNKILKVKNKCHSLQKIIILNDEDLLNKDDFITSFKEIQKAGQIYKSQQPELFKEKLLHVNENDLASIIYTSGTTGEPKGVMLTHKNIFSNVAAALECIPISENDVFLSFLPLCHIFERMAGYYTGFSAGGTICFSESIEAISQNMQILKPTLMTSVPRLFERVYSKIIKNAENLPKTKKKLFDWALNVGYKYGEAKRLGRVPVTLITQYKLADKLVLHKIRDSFGGRLRFFISGGAALPKELAAFFYTFGIQIIEGYGLTESSPVIALNRLDDFKFGTVGKALPGVEIKIASDGEILARGPNIMQGYYKNKKETDEVLKDGWLHTGDIGVFDSDGFLKITDRKKHLFKTSNGKYVAPTPIENLFLCSKYIDQFVLIGDRRTYLSALIVPDFEALKEYADSHNISYSNVEELTKVPEIYKMMESELSKFQKKLANYERVRKFTLLEKPFTLEEGEVTPSMKIRRKVIEQRYKNLIESMYQN